jgi:hypothetical protein
MSIISTVAAGTQNGSGGGSVPRVGFISADIKFPSSCEYDLGNGNQYDWNKVIGLIHGTYISARWGWRWNTDTGMIEIAPYIHDNSNFPLLPGRSLWSQLPLNTWINLTVMVDRANKTYTFIFKYNGNILTHTVTVTNSIELVYGSYNFYDLLYFGGTQNAPHDISIDYDNLVMAETEMYTCVGGNASWRVSYTDVDGKAASWYGNANTEKKMDARTGTVVVTMGTVTITS